MIQVLVVLVIVGVCLYLVQTYIPMAAPIKTVITVVVVLFLCLWLLQVFGVMDVPVPRTPLRSALSIAPRESDP